MNGEPNGVNGVPGTTAAAPRPPVTGYFAAVLLLQVVAGGLAQRANLAVGLAWSELAAFLLPALITAAGCNLAPGRFLLLTRRPTGAQVGLGVLAGLAGFAAAGGLAGLWSLLLPASWVRAYDLLSRFQGSWAQRVGLAAVAAALAPLCEEIAFRGYLQSALRLRLRAGPAVVIGSLLFAAMHLNPVSLPGLVLLGLLFGWLAWRTGSIWPSVAAHATNNTVASLMALAAVEQTGAAPPPEPLSALALLGVGAAALPALRLAIQRATADVPPAGDAVAPRDPTHPPGLFRFGRVPATLVGTAVAASLALAVLMVWKGVRR